MSKKRSLTLYFFRTRRAYFLGNCEPSQDDIERLGQTGTGEWWAICLGWRRPPHWPSLEKGECRPVEVEGR